MGRLKRQRTIEILSEERKGDELLLLNVGPTTGQVVALDHRETNLYQVTMGYVSAVALGLALSLPSVKVISIEGDGSLLMGLEKLCTIGNKNPKNLGLIIMDNETYGTAGQFYSATHGKTDLETIAKGAGIDNCLTVRSEDAYRNAVRNGLSGNELFAIIAKIEGKGPDEPLFMEDPEMQEGFPPLPFTQTENTYRFIRALVDRGLIPSWYEVYPMRW